MNTILFQAIQNRHRVRFLYNEKERIGEPQCYGISTAGKEIVRVHLIRGGLRPEQLFEVARMQSLELLTEHFTKDSGAVIAKGSVVRGAGAQIQTRGQILVR